MSLFQPGADWSVPVLPVRPGDATPATKEPPPVEEHPAFFIDDQRESSKKEDEWDETGDNERWLCDFDTKSGEQYRASRCGNRQVAMEVHKSWMEQRPGTQLRLTFDSGEVRLIPYTSIIWLRVYKEEA